MDWSDFLEYFDCIDVCFAKRDMSTLALPVVEECGCCGPACGCAWGA
jgi:hypothetical protein